jgi:hypothetical protein
MMKTVEQKPRKQPIQCWSFGGDHMHKDCPHRGDKARNTHNVQQVAIVEDIGKNVPNIYTALDKTTS